MPDPNIIHHTLTERLSASTLDYVEVVGDGPPIAAYIAGIHGNETDVIDPFYNGLLSSMQRGELKKSFIVIKHAHPAAIAAGTRTGNGLDFNRMFTHAHEPVDYAPVKLLLECMDIYPSIETIVTVHQDIDRTHEFYMYLTKTKPLDLAKETRIDRARRHMASAMWKMGIDQYSGPDDEELGNYVVYGKVITEARDRSVEWHIAEKLGITTICLEFPKVAPQVMEKVVSIVQSQFTNPVVEGGA